MPSTGVTDRPRYVLGRGDAGPTAVLVLGLLRRGSGVLRVHLWPEAGIEDLLRCPGACEGDRVFLDTQRVCCLQASNGIGVGQFLRDNRAQAGVLVQQFGQVEPLCPTSRTPPASRALET